MSQYWHANWAEDSFKPIMLGNWEVPHWHPKWPCSRHSATTRFVADNSGRLLPNQPRPKSSPWGNYKGTWELPKRIDRNTAAKLSAPPRHEISAWEAHKKHYEGRRDSKPSERNQKNLNQSKNSDGNKATTVDKKSDKSAREKKKAPVTKRRGF